MHAFVLMSVQPGTERQVISHLMKLDKVIEAFIIYGQYDLMIEVQADTREELWAFIGRELRVIEGARGTLTLIPIHGFKR